MKKMVNQNILNMVVLCVKTWEMNIESFIHTHPDCLIKTNNLISFHFQKELPTVLYVELILIGIIRNNETMIYWERKTEIQTN